MADNRTQLILVLAPIGRDAAAAEQTLQLAGLECAVCTGVEELVRHLEAGAGVALIAEEALLGARADALSQWVTSQPPWSDFPFFILTSRVASHRAEKFRARLIEKFGNVSLLERPLSAASMISTLKAALRARTHQYEIRDLLRAREEEATQLEKIVQDRTRELVETNKLLRSEMAERRQAEAALQQAQKMEALGQMTGGIAHDFNNLLTAVLGNLDLASRRVQDERIARLLGGATQAAKRGAKLTGQLLAFARKQHLQAEPTDLNALVSGMSDLLVRTIGERVHIESSLQPGLWPALVDPGQMELIVLNLALNARDAMQEGGRLRIATQNCGRDDDGRPSTLTMAGDFVSLTVADNGTGMSEEVRAKAFEPFFTTKPAGAGTGLGLSQVYGITQQLGGHVHIETSPGRGTSIKLYLPRAMTKAEGRSADEPDEHIENSEAATVLVVDDDPDVRAFTVTCLESLGYNVLVADGGQSALPLLNADRTIDLMLVDVIMPELQGPEVARRALAIRPAMRIVFMTGYVAQSGKAISDHQVISKPFTVAELARAVRDALRRSGDTEHSNVISMRQKR